MPQPETSRKMNEYHHKYHFLELWSLNNIVADHRGVEVALSSIQVFYLLYSVRLFM